MGDGAEMGTLGCFAKLLVVCCDGPHGRAARCAPSRKLSVRILRSKRATARTAAPRTDATVLKVLDLSASASCKAPKNPLEGNGYSFP